MVLAGAAAVGWYLTHRGGTPETAPEPAPTTQAAAVAPPVTAARPVTQAAAPETLPPATLAAVTPTTVAESVTVVKASPKVAALPPTSVAPGKPAPGKSAAPATTVPAAPVAPPPAVQAANLVTQAQAAAGTRNYDAAISLYDEALKLDPQNAAAHAGKAAAAAARTAMRRTFVTGRTVVQSEKKSGGIAGFDSSDVSVQKAPDFQGRIEFAVSPATVKPGDPYTLQIALVNEGKKAIKISGMTVTMTVNGSPSSKPIPPRVKEIAPQQRAVLEELPGVWAPTTSSWQTEVLVTGGKGDSLKNQVTWK